MKAKTNPPQALPHKTHRRSCDISIPTSKCGDYQVVSKIGSGTFGAVFEVSDSDGRHYAIKKVLQDPRYKNRELDTLKRLNHPNCLRLVKSFYTRENDKVFLHIVSDMFPTDLSKFANTSNNRIHPDLVRIFAYQIFSALHYLHSIGICHRDLKPTNVLIDPSTGYLQLCDFGSAKPIHPDEESVSYIATRNYRAPELLYDSTKYSFPVDIWAAGCIIAELLKNGIPIFKGESNDDMKSNVISILGNPTTKDLKEFGVTSPGSMPKTRKRTIGIKKQKAQLFPNQVVPDALIDLLEKIFVYSPSNRITAAQCLMHPFFEPILNQTAVLPNGQFFRLPQVLT